MLGVADDEQLPVRQARAGDSEAWEALLRRYQLPWYAYRRDVPAGSPGSAGIIAGKFRASSIATRRQGCRRSQGGSMNPLWVRS